MDVILKIAFAASGIIIAVLFVGFYNISVDNSVECAKLDNDLYQHVLAYNKSAELYRYRASDLDGRYDLPGDILAWRNFLLNEHARIQHEAGVFERKCGKDFSTNNYIFR